MSSGKKRGLRLILVVNLVALLLLLLLSVFVLSLSQPVRVLLSVVFAFLVGLNWSLLSARSR